MQVKLAVLGYKCVLLLVLNSLTHLGRSCLSGKEMAANQLGNEQISSDLTFFWFCRMPFLSLWDRWETLGPCKLWRLLHWGYWGLHELVNYFINVVSNVMSLCIPGITMSKCAISQRYKKSHFLTKGSKNNRIITYSWFTQWDSTTGTHKKPQELHKMRCLNILLLPI